MSVPALRFKEFSGDWITRYLSSILGKLESGVSVNSEDIPANGLDEYGILKTSCIVNGYFIEQENKKIISEDIARAKLNPSEDTILVSRMNTPQLVGEVGYVSKDYPNLFVPDRLWLIEVKNKHRDSTKYLSHQLASKKTKNILTNIASGTSGSMKNISQPSFLKIELNTPEFKEQTKIANFLTAVDQKISLLTQKADLLSQYKKGVMQQIFKQELRFKDDDGQEFPEWEESELGKVSTIIMGQSPDSKSYNDIDEGQPLIQGNADISNRKTNPRIWTSQPTKECKINDIILTVRAPVGAVAKSYHNACIGRGVCAIRNSDKSTTDFIYHLLLWFEPTKWVSLEQGSTFTAVNSNDIKTLTIPVPCLKEQTKIANFLTAIDDKITTNQTQLNAVKQYKQGLLQQMFV